MLKQLEKCKTEKLKILDSKCSGSANFLQGLSWLLRPVGKAIHFELPVYSLTLSQFKFCLMGSSITYGGRESQPNTF